MKYLIFISLLFFSLICYGCFYQQQAEEIKNQQITILWAKWPPADILQELSKDFTAETGIKVEIKQVPWNQFHDYFLFEMNQKSTKYDLVGGDSQWLGTGAYNGYYIDITKWLKRNDLDRTMVPAAMSGYAEYPNGSGRYWGIPLQGDAIGFAYRKDLFENLEEQRKFKERYGYELNIPETWDQMKDIAEFFYRPENSLYGIAMWVSNQYDAITMGVDTFLWSWGADIGNKEDFKIKGILNSQKAVEALEAYKELYQFSSSEWRDAYLEINKPFMAGQVAMVMNYFAFFPELLDEQKNPYASATGFFVNPAGPSGRFSSLGGQGLSLISYSKKKHEAFAYLKWFARHDVQQKWARMGGYSCDKRVLHSQEFLEATPFNQALMESMEILRDFWTTPEYAELLEISQRYFYQYVTTDSISAEETLEIIADQWERIFELAGYYKE